MAKTALQSSYLVKMCYNTFFAPLMRWTVPQHHQSLNLVRPLASETHCGLSADVIQSSWYL